MEEKGSEDEEESSRHEVEKGRGPRWPESVFTQLVPVRSREETCSAERERGDLS